MDDPEGNLVIVERVGHESQRRFPYWEYGWVGTAHSTEQHCTRHHTASSVHGTRSGGLGEPALPRALNTLGCDHPLHRGVTTHRTAV